MKDNKSRFSLALKAFVELGPRQAGLYAAYQVGLRTGFFQRKTRSKAYSDQSIDLQRWGPLPDPDYLGRIVGPGRKDLFASAEQLLAGSVLLFGELPARLNAVPPASLRHWTRFRGGQVNGQDIKFCWEPARFGWAFSLARAYHLSADERFSAFFWQHLRAFLLANPPNLGPNWASAQEAGLRLMSLVFAGRLFLDSVHSSPENLRMLGGAIAAHAARIPVTLVYARAQNNNHLLSEAAALYTAGIYLRDHPDAGRWLRSGWKWFHRGLQAQVASDGAYMQQSSSYHRLMLQLALWMQHQANQVGQSFPQPSRARLAAATEWLLALTDAGSGRVPNLGPNDGAYIFPASTCAYQDYRPVLQAASLAFRGEAAFGPGPWDEMQAWFPASAASLRSAGLKSRLASDMSASRANQPESEQPRRSPAVLIHPELPARAYLRAAHFENRPGHADQLHVDIWWRGLNIARDAGTYLYNASQPWQNALVTAFQHNTITVNGLDQMTPAGRFLYLDRAQAQIIEHDPGAVTAEHDGYRQLGLIHRRKLSAAPQGWLVEDQLLAASRRSDSLDASQRGPQGPPAFLARLHWLLPDWPYHLAGSTIRVKSSYGWIELSIRSGSSGADLPAEARINLIRAGELLNGLGPADKTHGWYSPTYALKEPALSFAVEFSSPLPLELRSTWKFS